MNEYLKAQTRTNAAILANTFNQDEFERFAKSDYRWADNRAKPYRHRTVKKGEVYQFEFGKNYHPEMSYEHRGLVIGVKQKLLYVLPIFSYIPAKHISVFHPIDFPDSNFPSFYHEYDQLNQKMLDLCGAYEECKKKLEHLIAENKDLKNQLSFLNDQ